MSTITIGFASPDLTGAVSSRASVSADPDAFAAQLQSASETGTSILAPESAPPVGLAIALPTIDIPPAATDAPLVRAVPPASFALPNATPPDPIVAEAPLSAPVPVVRPDADTSQSAATSTPNGTAPLRSVGVSQEAATSVARPVDPAAPSAPVPSTSRRAPRHVAASDALPQPIAAVAAAPLPINPSASAPIPIVPPLSLAGDESVADEAVAITGSPSVATEAAPAARPASSRGTAEKTAGPGRSPVAPVPALSTTALAAPVGARSAVGNSARQAVRVVATTAPDSQAFAVPLAEPTVRPAAAALVSPPAEATPQPQALSAQLAPPILALRSAGRGTHTLTLTVSPESVGPVTVRAHVTGGVMRIELSAPTDQGTDALQSMLSDLKRDLSQGGVNSALTVASSDSGGLAAGSQNAFGGAGGFSAGDGRPSYLPAAPPTPMVTTVNSTSPNRVAATTALDVLA